jgi:N-methylhydantoinase B
MEKDGTDLIVRNAGTADQTDSLNLPFGGWRDGCTTPFSVLLRPELMGAVGGVLRHLRFEPPPGTISTPTYGAAVSPAGTYGGEMAIGMAQSVLEKMLLPSDDEELQERVVTPTHMHWMFNVISGNTQDDEFFIGPMLDGVLGSPGATPFRDGRSGDGWIGCPTARDRTSSFMSGTGRFCICIAEKSRTLPVLENGKGERWYERLHATQRGRES